MTDTARLGLPLLAGGQAQKHITVNEALERLDGLVMLCLESISLATPPAVVRDGVAYGVPEGAVNDWAGAEGQIAIGANGGWVFATPARGWRAFVAAEGAFALHSGVAWVLGAATLSQHGAALKVQIREEEVALGTGTTALSAPLIPSHAMVIGVTARVSESLGGTATGFRIGHAGAEDRFGSGIGTGLGAWARGMLSSPMTYWADTALQLTAEGGSFSGGSVRLAVHYLEIGLPSV